VVVRVVIVVIIAAATAAADRPVGIGRGVKAVVADRAAVRQQEHQQLVVIDGPHADQFAAVIHLLFLAVDDAVEADVGQLREAR